MSVFVLVHGSWHGGWCWERVVPFLQASGHEAYAPDMPAMGRDRTLIHDATFALGVERIVAQLAGMNRPVILVGHSMAGLLITQVAEERPDSISELIYLSAYLPKNGDSCFDLSMADHGLVPYGLEMSADGRSANMVEPWITPSFYNDCTDEDVAFAKDRLRPQPMEPFMQRVSITAGRAGSVPRAYIGCLRDHAITPGFQSHMQMSVPCDTVLTLDTGHSPFLSAPAALASHLNVLAKARKLDGGAVMGQTSTGTL